jgi:hypothetical protein
LAVFLVGILCYRPWGDSSEMCVICGGCSAICFGGRAGVRRRIVRFSGPGMLPSMRMYGLLMLPYRRKVPFGVTSLPSLPIFKMRLLYSMRWW